MLKFIQVVSIKAHKKVRHIKYIMLGSEGVYTHSQLTRYDQLFIKIPRLKLGINYIVDVRIGLDVDDNASEIWVDWLATKSPKHLQQLYEAYSRTNDLLSAAIITENLKEHYDPVTKAPTASGEMLMKYRTLTDVGPVRIGVLGEEFRAQRKHYTQRKKVKKSQRQQEKPKTLEDEINMIVDKILARPKKKQNVPRKPVIPGSGKMNSWHWKPDALKSTNGCKKKKRPPVKK